MTSINPTDRLRHGADKKAGLFKNYDLNFVIICLVGKIGVKHFTYV